MAGKSLSGKVARQAMGTTAHDEVLIGSPTSTTTLLCRGTPATRGPTALMLPSSSLGNHLAGPLASALETSLAGRRTWTEC